MQNTEIIRASLDEILSHFGIEVCELNSRPSGVIDFYDVAAHRNGAKLVIGYFSDDHAPFNPLEDDGCGHLVHREDCPSTFYGQLGRNREGEPCESLAENGDFEQQWYLEAFRSLEFTEFARDYLVSNNRELSYRGFHDAAESIFRGGSLAGRYVNGFEAYDKALRATWSKEVLVHPETRFSCPVNIDSYGFVSIDGPDAFEDPECDVDKWSSVWVPCAEHIEMINEKAAVYRFGNVVSTFENGKHLWSAKLKDVAGGEKSPQYFSRDEAYAWLQVAVKEQNLEEKYADADECSLRSGEIKAVVEIAQACLSEYEAYLKGECFNEEFDTFVLQGEGDDASWVLSENDSCGGFFSARYVCESIVSSIESMQRHDLNQAEPAAA